MLRKEDSPIEIRIVEVQVRDGKLGSKHVVYKIKGKDHDGAYEVFRRYSDFNNLRTLFVERWPGIVIPPIPSKKSVGNMEAVFVKDRMKFLEAFLIRVSEMPNLYHSEEFQMFLKNPTADLEKAFTKIKKLSTEEILRKYQQMYPSLVGKEVTSDHSATIMNFQMSLIKMLAYFDKTAEAVVSAKKKYYESMGGFRDKLMVEYERLCMAEYSSPNQPPKIFQAFHEQHKTEKPKKVLNSFEYIYDFIRITEKDIKTFLQAIEQRDKCQASKEKLIEKQRSLGVELQGLLAGKTTMKSLISRKDKSSEVEACERHIEEVKKELEMMTQLHNMVTLILAINEIKLFKDKKMDRFYRLIRKASSNEVTQLGEVRKLWAHVLSDEDVSKRAQALGLFNVTQEAGGQERAEETLDSQ